MTSLSHDDDEFFGSQADEFTAHSSVQEGLTRHDNHALQERFRVIGFHEAHDESKDIRLQEGFELGYRELIDVSIRIGQILGEVTTKAAISDPSEGEIWVILLTIQQEVFEEGRMSRTYFYYFLLHVIYTCASGLGKKPILIKMPMRLRV